MKQQRSQVEHNWLPSFHFISFCFVLFFSTNISSLVWPQFIFYFFQKSLGSTVVEKCSVITFEVQRRLPMHYSWHIQIFFFVPLILVPPRLNKVKEKEKTSNNNYNNYNNNNRHKNISFTKETIFSCNENNKNFSVCNY